MFQTTIYSGIYSVLCTFWPLGFGGFFGGAPQIRVVQQMSWNETTEKLKDHETCGGI